MHWHRLQLMSANTLCSALIKLFFSLSLERDLSLSLFSAQSASLNMFIIYQCLLLFHYYTRRKEQCWNISVNMFRTIRLKWNMFSLEIFIHTHTHTPLIFYTWWYFRSTYKYRANTFFNILTKISQIFIWKCHTFAITLQYFLSLSVCLLLSRSFEMTEMYMCWSNSIDQLFSLHFSLCLSICVCAYGYWWCLPKMLEFMVSSENLLTVKFSGIGFWYWGFSAAVQMQWDAQEANLIILNHSPTTAAATVLMIVIMIIYGWYAEYATKYLKFFE